MAYRCNFRRGLLAALLLGSFGSASATVVTPAGAAFLNGTTVAAEPDLAGVVISDTLIPFELKDGGGNVILSGNYQDRVVRSDNTGRLIFAPRLRDLTGPPTGASVIGLQITGFDNVTTDIEYRLDGLGQVGPSKVVRSVTGDELVFDYLPAANVITPPDEGRFLSIATGAPEFANLGSVTIFGLTDLGPTIYTTRLLGTNAPVPLPPAVGLLALALGGLTVFGRRRTKKAS